MSNPPSKWQGVPVGEYISQLWYLGKGEASDPTAPAPGDPQHCALCLQRHELANEKEGGTLASAALFTASVSR